MRYQADAARVWEARAQQTELSLEQSGNSTPTVLLLERSGQSLSLHWQAWGMWSPRAEGNGSQWPSKV